MSHWKQRYSLAAVIAVLICPQTLWSTVNSQSRDSEVRVIASPCVRVVAQVESHEETGSIPPVTDSTFPSVVLNEEAPVLVAYWAVWAGPSQMLAPILLEIAEDYVGKLKVVRLDIDENPETPREYGVQAIPTLMLFAQGKPIATKVGALSREQLAAWLDESLKK